MFISEFMFLLEVDYIVLVMYTFYVCKLLYDTSQ